MSRMWTNFLGVGRRSGECGAVKPLFHWILHDALNGVLFVADDVVDILRRVADTGNQHSKIV